MGNLKSFFSVLFGGRRERKRTVECYVEKGLGEQVADVIKARHGPPSGCFGESLQRLSGNLAEMHRDISVLRGSVGPHVERWTVPVEERARVLAEIRETAKRIEELRKKEACGCVAGETNREEEQPGEANAVAEKKKKHSPASPKKKVIKKGDLKKPKKAVKTESGVRLVTRRGSETKSGRRKERGGLG
ncbi:MAG: uncharacterized protein A8A55_1196 [Amphiamblys sp. WSBS2006]|nr:MAG: uncharacterized protein A8A55_1196 [Amphiamblys sp. WSBS2006]